MSPAQYCARYGIAESTLRGWLKRGLMEGAEKCGGIWDIPEDARARYEPRKKKNRTQDDNRWDLLKALKERRYVDEKVLLCQKADFVDLANDLLDKGFIIMSSTPCDGNGTRDTQSPNLDWTQSNPDRRKTSWSSGRLHAAE